MENRGLTTTVLIGSILIVAVCLWRITAGTATQTEALLLSVILTFCSTAASWVVSKFYADYSYDKNLKVFALKAAEKVTNLSNELARLSAYLQQGLEDADSDSPKEQILRMDAKLEAAIHMIGTLKSVNDKSLSDWQGVIGEEITAQREAQEEREEHLSQLLERLESLPALESSSRFDGQDQAAELSKEMQSIRKDLRVLGAQVSGMPVRALKLNPPRQTIEHTCPSCSATVRYRQRPRENSVKSLECDGCRAKLYSIYSNDRFEVGIRKPIAESVVCPSCGITSLVEIDPVPGTQTPSSCGSCGNHFFVVRTKSGVVGKGALGGRSQIVSEKLLADVQSAMPEQPWPTGAGKKVAVQLGVPNSLVAAAIDELIKRGIFKTQIDGKLYESPITKIDGSENCADSQ